MTQKLNRPNRISVVRKAAGLSQPRLAEALGVHWITISKLERGEMKLTTEWMDKIGAALKVDPSTLVWKSEVLGTIRIAGNLKNGAISLLPADLGYDESLPLAASFLDDPAVLWAHVDDDTFQPMFAQGDLIQLHFYENSFENHIGRIAFLETSDFDHYFGRLVSGTKGNWDILPLSGKAVRHLKIKRLGVMSAAIFGLPKVS